MDNPLPRVLCIALLCAGVCAPHAAAQSYPSKPIRAILALGGGGETLARMIGQKLSESMGQPVLIEVQPAASGSIAAATVARAAPDGYTILHATAASQIYRPVLAKNVPYDPVKDFTPIAMVGDAAVVVAASIDSGMNSMKDLIERARREPGKVFYGTSGVGTTHHLSAELVQALAGVRMVHVPYKDANQVAVELIANRIPVGFGIFGTLYKHHAAGKLRIIASNNTRRYERIGDIPTIGEELPGYEPPPGWNGFFGPAKMAQPIVHRLNAEINRAITAPDLQAKLSALGFIATPGAPEELGAAVKLGLERAARIAKSAGIEPE